MTYDLLESAMTGAQVTSLILVLCCVGYLAGFIRGRRSAWNDIQHMKAAGEEAWWSQQRPL